ncbi:MULTISPECIES: hypothetical protein [Sulfolobaceae]|uniref:hypothetical protein n=1 Tax=Sulfolobaceae TaxID=118883 RepID=UPI00117BEED9|nr:MULTISPECIES: hypothetical protein [unclassified Sulfolobus]
MERQIEVGVKCKECGTINKRGRLFCYNCGSLIENEEVKDKILTTYLYNIVTNIDKMSEVLDAKKDYVLGDSLKADYYIEFKDHIELIFIIKSYNEFIRFIPASVNKNRIRYVLILAFKEKNVLEMANMRDDVDMYKLAIIHGEYKLIPLTNNNEK